VGALRSFWLGDADLAPVAAFRILYGIQLVNWFWQLYPNLNAFFTDEGILPRRALLIGFPERFSLLTLFGEWWQVAIVWALSCLVAVLLTLGWRTRVMSFLAFVMVSSFSWRNPLILDGSDFVFRILPLWLTFTRAGELYSLDALARRRRGDIPSGRGPALPVRILELQVAWIYLATGLEKLTGKLWLDGTAVWYALQLEHTFARWWARPIVENPALVRLITWGTLAVELGFLPVTMTSFKLPRVIAVALAAGLHLGILAMMNVGNFPVIMLSALVLFLPPLWIRAFVDRVVRTFESRLGVAAREFLRRLADQSADTLPVMRSGWAIPGTDWLTNPALVVLATFALITAVPPQLEVLRPKGEFASLLRFMSADQRWDMFSPNPSNADGWMLAPARLADGTTFDLFSGGPVDESSERYTDPLYTRWLKVHDRIANASYADYRLEYARYYCRSRNFHLSPGQVPLASFELFYVERVIRAPEEGPPIINRYHLWTHEC
jgi:vitamin K-dependent gamma-carboxylase-like protein